MKKSLAIILSVMLLFSTLPFAVFAETDEGSAPAGNSIDEIASQLQDPSDDPFDFVTPKAARKSARSAHPDSYDLRDEGIVTPVKFQNPFGTCWGFAAIAAAETSILGDPDVRGSYTADTLDLSEKHLVYFVAQAIEDRNDPQYGEGTHAEKGVSVADKLNMGGLSFRATNLFASGLGPLVEDDGTEMPTLRYMGADGSKEYRMINDVLEEYCYDDEDDWSLPEEYRFLHNFSLSESYMLPSPAHVDQDTEKYTYNAEATEAIKEMLVNNRAVEIGFCADTSSPSQEAGDGIYISKNWAHYTYDASETPNHAVTIVGWDDDYPKENFVEGHNPPEDGAWLVKNSWGSEEETFPNRGPGWGIENENGEHTGYFWLSYFDKTLDAPEALAFDRNNETENEGYYVDAHDFMPPNDVEGAAVPGETKMANVFKARNCQLLEGVSCQTSYPGTKVVSEVYVLPSDFRNPTDGMKVATVEGQYEYGGFHKMKLDSPVQIQKGQYYSIVQTQTIPDGEYAVNMPVALNETFSKAIGEKTWVQGVVNKNESYMYADGAWHDYADKSFVKKLFGDSLDIMTYDNFPIKGYCRIQSDISIRVNGNTLLDLYGDSESVLRVTFKGHAGAAVRPEIEWKLSEDGSDIFSLTPDPSDKFRIKVSANAVGRANLFVTVKGAGTTVVPLSVRKKVLGGMCVYDDEIVYTGKPRTPKVGVTDEHDEDVASEHYVLKYSNNIKCGRAKVTATAKKGDPEYEGSTEIEFTIMPAKAKIKSLTDGKTSLTVSVVDQKASGVIGYDVQYRVKGTSSWSTKSFKASSSRFVLKNLKTGKNYQVRVCAKAVADPDTGFANAGHYSAVMTSDKIGSMPKKPAIKNLKSGKRKLTITLKGKKAANVAKYTVKYRVKGTKKWKTKTFKATGNKIVLTKLKKGKKYQVKVCAIKAGGVSSKYCKAKKSKKIK